MQLIERHGLNDFIRCPRKYYYRFVLGLEPKVESEALFLGSLFHEKMGNHLNASLADAEEPISEYLDRATLEQINLVDDMFEYWQQQAEKEFWADVDQILAVEETFTLEIGDYGTPFTPDVIYRSVGGPLVVIDHKTVGSIKEGLAFLPLDPQFRKYAAGIYQRFGEAPELVYSMHRRELPPNFTRADGTKPYALTPTGRDSTRSTKVDDYLYQARIKFTPNQIKATMDEFASKIADLEVAKEHNRFSRREIKGGSYGCTNCEYFEPCKREYDGHKLDGLTLQYQYDRTNKVESPVEN